MNAVLIGIVMAVVIALEGPKLLKYKHYKDLAVFLILVGSAFGTAFLLLFSVQLPSPSKLIATLIKQIIHIKLGY